MDPRVVEAMLPYFTEKYGNAASRNHAFGWAAEEAVDKAREQIASLIGAKSKEIIFTSGATETDNLAIKGVVEMYKKKGNHVITCVTEHKAVLDSASAGAGRQGDGHLSAGGQVRDGRSRGGAPGDHRQDHAGLDHVRQQRDRHASSDRGDRQDRQGKGRAVPLRRGAGGGQGAGGRGERGIDLLRLTAHKIYGPKGVGALYVRAKGPRVRLTPIIDGGGHERGMRSGTLDVTGIVGFGVACEVAGQEMDEESGRMLSLRDKLQEGIFERLDEVYLNGHPTERLPGNLNLSFAYVEGEALMMGIKDIAVSSGSACTSASLEPTYVLKALGSAKNWPTARSASAWAVSTPKKKSITWRTRGATKSTGCAT